MPVAGLSLKSTSSYTAGDSWKLLPIGGGGFATGLSMSTDGKTVVVRTDSSGAYVWNETAAKWTSITNANVIPAGYTYGIGGGTYDAVVAPSNSNVIYQMVNGFMFKSTDRGLSFVALTNFNGGIQLPNGSVNANGGGSRLFGPKMAVDPQNADILVVGTGVNGAFITKDGGTTWTTLPVPPTCPQDYYIVPLNTTVTAASTLNFNTVAFTSVPASGGFVFDLTSPSSIPLGAKTVSKANPNVTIDQTVTVAAGDSILFLDSLVKAAATSALSAASTTLTFTAAPTVSNGFTAINLSNLASIPAGTTVTGSNATTVTLSAAVTVASGDVIGLFSSTNSTIDYSGYSIAFDPLSAVVANATQGIYIAPWNSPIQQSTDGGTTWTALNSGAHPYAVQTMQFAPSGILWVASQSNDYKTGGNSNVWSFTAAGGTFTNYTASASGASNPTHIVAPDPNNAGSVVTMSSAGVAISGTSNNFASTTGTFLSVTYTYDATWLNTLNNPASGYIMFHPTRTGELWCAQGVGVMRLVVPATNQAIQWQGIVNGIENLTTANILATPAPGAKIHVTVWDRGLFRIDDITHSATSSSWVTNTTGIFQGGGVDYSSSDPNFLVAVAATNGSTLHSSYSTNGGASWTQFATQINSQTGAIAATSPNAIIFIPSTNGNPGLPYRSTDQGTTWATNIAGLPTTGAGYYGGFTAKANTVCADKNAANTFYIAYQTGADAGNGIWRSTDAGATWTHTFSGNLTSLKSNCRLSSIPGEAAGTLLYCGAINQGVNSVLKICTDSGVTWSNINVLLTNMIDYGFGMAAPGASHVTLYVIGTYNSVDGVFASSDLGASFTQISDFHPGGAFQPLAGISGDWGTYGRLYVAVQGIGYYYRNYVSG